MEDLPDVLERLTLRVEMLERRVAVLEQPAALADESAQSFEPQSAAAALARQGEEAPSLAQAGSLFSVLGKAMLGIAGAYVLRAVAESSSLPKTAIAALAIAYAILWLVGAVRIPAGALLASGVYAGTSALILAPMLWELTLRFKVLPAAAAAALLGAFVLAASVLAWKRDLAPVFWVANGTAAAVALALAIATHDLMPFLWVLLLMVLICEYAAERNHELSVRPMVALAADLAVWAVLFIYSGPAAARAEYPALSAVGLLLPSALLFLIFAASVTLRVTVLRQRISIFETVQSMLAFLLAALSVLYFVPQGGRTAFGLICLALSAAGYAAVSLLFEKAEDPRNSTVFGGWSAALLATGCVLTLPPLGLSACLAAAAITATLLGPRLGRRALELHGLFYLAAAAVGSGLFGYIPSALAGSLPVAPGWSVAIVSLAAVICYAAGPPDSRQGWAPKTLRLMVAVLAVGATAAWLVQGFVWLAALAIAPEVHHIAFARTLTLCGAAVALAYAGSHWRRLELLRLAYATVGLVAVKLLFEDLRHGHLEFIAASIFLFAVALLTVPRLARTGNRG